MHCHGCSRKFSIRSCAVHYSMTGGRCPAAHSQGERRPGFELRAKTLKRHIFFTPAEIRLAAKALAQDGREFREIKPSGVRLLADFRNRVQSGHGGRKSGRCRITTQILRARAADPAWVWISAVAIPLMLLAPALWNGYPLLQWDTGGYLARWYEGYLVPSRSTVFGLYLHFGEGFELLAQPRDSGAGDAVDPATDAAGVRHRQAVAASGSEPRADPDHGAALARQHAADRHLCRPVGAVAVSPGAARRQDFGDRKIRAVRLYRLRRGHPQRDARRAVRAVLRRLDRAALLARPDCRRRPRAGHA